MTLSPVTKTLSLLLLIATIAVVIMAAIAADALLWLVAGIFIIGVSLVALLRASAKPITVIADSLLANRKERNRHEEEIVKRGFVPPGYRPVDAPLQITAPAPRETPVDPGHALLINLCLLTIKSAAYGPTAARLMSADDAQADRSGLFADRMNWDAASKYGQGIGLLFTQRGGPPDQQGLKIKAGSASDLLVALHNRNLILDAAITALPGVTR